MPPLEHTMHGGWAQPQDLTRRLPVKILSIIFHYWKDSCPSHLHGLFADWVCATWVCKRWREVALEIPGLWSTILISQGATDDPAFEVQLDRARGMALDLFVYNPEETSGDVEDALKLVLARRSPVKKLKVVCYTFHPVVVEFIKTVAADVLALSLSFGADMQWLDKQNRWEFTSDVFPRLQRLVLSRIIPTPGTPLLHLTQLELKDALDDFAAPPRTGVHQFLAACPNLEVLRMDNCFSYETDDMIEASRKDILPVVTLPKLRSLWINQLALDVATVVGTLRLPALSTFDITADCNIDTYNCTFYVIPQNINEALPPIRRSRCLSLSVSGPTNDLSLRDGPGNTFEDSGASDCMWSVMLPDLEVTTADSDFLHYPFCIRYNCHRFMDRLSDPAVPANLVRLELHISDGLPVARDWARFFATMPHLRTLVIGSGALIRLALGAFGADVRLCPELGDLELCLGGGVTTDTEESGLAELVLRTVGAWVRGRATPLRSLTVRARTEPDGSPSASNDDDSDLESASSSDPASRSDEERSGGTGSTRCDTETADLAWTLCRDVGLTLKAFVRKVFLVGSDCFVCDVEYDPVEWDPVRNDELPDGVEYY